MGVTMKVSISHGEKSKGLIFTKRFYTVTIKVQFSNEELAIIDQRKLKNIVVLERDCPPDEKHFKEKGKMTRIATNLANGFQNPYNLTIGKLVKGPDTYTLVTPADAKNYEHEFTEMLPTLKGYVDMNAAIGTSKQFEL